MTGLLVAVQSIRLGEWLAGIAVVLLLVVVALLAAGLRRQAESSAAGEMLQQTPHCHARQALADGGEGLFGQLGDVLRALGNLPGGVKDSHHGGVLRDDFHLTGLSELLEVFL